MWSESGISSLYDSVFHRKAIRKYTADTLDKEMLDELVKNIDNLAAPLPEARAEFRVLTTGQIKGMLSAKAPHFLAVYAKRDADSLINAAFKLQQIDLLMSSLGLGACWLGMTKPVKEMASADGLPFAIMLAFGSPAEEAHRVQVSEFNRKPLEEITDLDLGWLTEPVRLAPSGVNRQPWYISGEKNAVRLYCKQNGAVSKLMFGELAYFDMGIALCHLWLAAAEHGRFSSFQKEESSSVKVITGYQYVWTVLLE